MNVSINLCISVYSNDRTIDTMYAVSVWAKRRVQGKKQRWSLLLFTEL